ncbi:hypothetical protein CONCODRAFT_79391 [Conidiobolus coronatus NRRL 28638]|uniref:C2 domain-containing protein n=1 Tax=Conidiobolus coronatus (strain ATCC 28846 / CBS 209.66 / NRRL 28638) TaxID=796925 RepID=A0A137P2Q3_CONC2|nr:hypothetical protein CONCODRAFT_79391 [Conidiobolus coronatus NRRL 28638]|eukprot:KXN69302.1 hypothetical protein CONCODRAFT_79391 [Conidiobolus coronatus NRRL 28638]
MVKGKVEIKVIEAKELANRDLPLGRNDPFVNVIYGDKKFSTQIKKNAGESVTIHEAFTFELKEGIASAKVEVVDKDHMKDDLIGEFELSLAQVIESRSYENWFPIEYKGKTSGQVHLQLSFTPEGEATKK